MIETAVCSKKKQRKPPETQGAKPKFWRHFTDVDNIVNFDCFNKSSTLKKS